MSDKEEVVWCEVLGKASGRAFLVWSPPTQRQEQPRAVIVLRVAEAALPGAAVTL